MGDGTGIGRVRGLGSSRHGTGHWLRQRFTAIGNLVVVVYLVISLALLPSYDYQTAHDWISKPVPAAMMILLLINTMWHARLGVQVMLEDYVHEHGNKFGLTAALNLAAFGASAFGIISVLRLALGGA